MYGLVIDGFVFQVSRYSTKPSDPVKGIWLPMLEENALYDEIVQVRTGPETIIESDRVRLVYSIGSHPDALSRKRQFVYRLAQAIHDQKSAELESGYTEKQIRTFSQQKSEADAYTENSSAATPMIDELVSQRGKTKAEMVARINAKTTFFAQKSGELLGRLDAIGDLLESADMDEVKRIEREELNQGWG